MKIKYLFEIKFTDLYMIFLEIFERWRAQLEILVGKTVQRRHPQQTQNLFNLVKNYSMEMDMNLDTNRYSNHMMNRQ